MQWLTRGSYFVFSLGKGTDAAANTGRLLHFQLGHTIKKKEIQKKEEKEKIKKIEKKKTKKRKRKKFKKQEKKSKNKKRKRKKEKKFVFSSLGQHVRLLSLPHSWFSAMRKEGQLQMPHFVRATCFISIFVGPWAHLWQSSSLGLEPILLFYFILSSL